MTHEEKLKLYRAGKYVMGVPPVSTHAWTAESWIKHIDATGGWITPESERRNAEKLEQLRYEMIHASRHHGDV